MMDLDESDLIDGIETVPEGAIEVTRLKNEGTHIYARNKCSIHLCLCIDPIQLSLQYPR